MSTRESSTNKETVLFGYVLPGFCEYKGKQYKQGDSIILICFARFL